MLLCCQPWLLTPHSHRVTSRTASPPNRARPRFPGRGRGRQKASLAEAAVDEMSAIFSVRFLTNLGCLKKGSCKSSCLLQGWLAPALPPTARQQVPADDQTPQRARHAQTPADKLLSWPLCRRKISEERSLAPGEKPSTCHTTRQQRRPGICSPNHRNGSLD